MKLKLTWLMTLFMAFVMQISLAQEKSVSGTVTSASDGLPVPGVSVIVKGTTRGQQTDFDGKFSINVSPGETLVFSFISLKTTEVVVGASNTINVAMQEDVAALDEVVIVGYGTATKQSFTGSAKTVTAENLEVKSFSNVSQALAGEVAGVNVINTSGQPGTSATIRIRGFGSVNGNRSPLYVVDGVPFNGSGNINSINPADIKSTTVLKDATATAIYGARGANGVILITTKSGSAGESSINVDVKSGINVSLLPRNSVIRSPEQYVGLVWEGLYNRGVATGEANPEQYANQGLFSNAGLAPFYNMWNADGADLIDPATRTVRPGVTRKYSPENWEDYGFQTSYRQEANLSFSGGNEKTKYFSSFGYLDEEGYIINSDYKRYTTRLNITHKPKDWLEATANIGYAISETNNNGQSADSGSIFWFVDNIPSIYPLYLRDASGNRIPNNVLGGYVYDYGSDGRGFGALTNSIADATYDRSRAKRHELNSNFSFNVYLSDHLTFETRLGMQYYNNKYFSLNNPFYGSAAGQGGSIYRSDTEYFAKNFLQLLRYKNSWGKHGLEVLAAHEANDWTQKNNTASKEKAVVPYVDDLNNFIIVSSPPSSWTREVMLESYFGQINYDFDGKYYLSGSVRRDGSSRFVEGNKWGTFGSIGAGWVISQEDFLSGSSFVDFLKLKASYGLVGEQDGVGLYPGINTYDAVNNNGFSFPNRDYGNPDLTWETSKQFQAGVEFTLGKNGFLEGGVDYYRKNTDNLLFNRRDAVSSGVPVLTVNDGMLLNSGIEIDLTAHLVNTKDFKLDLAWNGEILNNEMKEMPIDPSTGEQKIIDKQGLYAYGVGQSLFDFYIREWAGVDPADGRAMWYRYFDDANGNGTFDAGEGFTDPADANGSGSIVEYMKKNPNANIQRETTYKYADATEKYVGKSAIPKIRGAFRLSTAYKNFDLSAQFLYSLGGYAYDSAYANLMRNATAGNNNYHTDILNRWQQPGDITDVPRLSDGYDTNVNSSSTRFLIKSDYLALNNIKLGYTLKSSALAASGVDNVNVFVSGDNLFILSKRDGFNPSTSETGGSDQYRYSPLSTFTLGVRVKF